MIAKFNNKEYKLIDSIDTNKSSREVTYSDLTLDFTNSTIDDLPYAQQEVQIYNKENNLIFTGFVSNYKLPELKDVNTSTKRLSLSLFSPRQMATKRTVTIMRTAKMSDIITQTLAPLYQDGFTFKEINIEDKVITVNLISRTVEEVLNYLSNKYSLYWNIDELKAITINSIDYMLNKEAKKIIDIDNYKEQISGLISISPSVENIDYANIINVKNARIFYSKFQTEGLNITLSNGDRLDFENPIDISLATAQRIEANLIEQGASVAVTNLSVYYNNNQEAYIVSGFNTSGQVQPGSNYKDIATDDSTGSKFVLTTDSTFKNLATGITYKGEGSVTIKGISSQTYLRYANMKLINWHEIEQNEGKITPSGQIEKILDVEQGWFTVEELVDYVRSTLKNNEKYTNQININTKETVDVEIGDKLTFNLSEYFMQGDFIVTGIKGNKDWCNPFQYNIELRNTNLLENFIDLFRSSSDIEEQQSQVEMEYVVEYVEEETIKETHEVTLDKDYNNTLNFILRG